MRNLLVFLALVFFVGSAAAHQDQLYVPNQVEWQMSEMESLEISIAKSGELSSVSLVWEGRSYSVPSSELKGIGPVDIRAVEYLGTDESRVGKYRIIRVGIGGSYCGNGPTGCDDSVRFMFRAGQYESRSIYRKIDESHTQIYRKLPGSDEAPEGAIYEPR